ncbi:DUF4374 domain-containing protein [Hoylesella oralis]|uniref:DUF4374 domain-containing protein n=1 Tax=Hoylesella oralis TaxID=28134 RepID=UPI0028E43350|nr:DUF4374 domain-containing protein [Hoylesella oralis]
MKKINFFKFAAVALVAGMLNASCNDGNDDNNGGTTPIEPSQVKFIVASGDPQTDLSGGVVLKMFSDLSAVKTDQSVYADTLAGASTTKVPDSFTQITYNQSTGVYTGYIYARGASAQGIGAMKAGLRSYKVVDGKLSQVGNPVLVSAFGNTGTFGNYSYAAQISQPYAMVVDNAGAGKNVELALTKYAIDEVNPNIGNIVDLGNDQVAIVLNYTNRDSAVVAFADYNLNISKVVYDGRIGASVGAQRSVRYSQSGTDDEGNLYVFCGSGVNGKADKVGALRIKKGETEFDKDYKFDIYAASDGYRFRKAFHISGDKFLLEFYVDKASYGNMSTSGKLAVVDMSDKKLTWVTGSEYLDGSNTKASISWGDGFDGYYYLPVSGGTSMNGGGGRPGTGGGRSHGVASRAGETAVTPTIFKIDAATGKATPFMTFKSSDLLKGISIIKK